jgi:hypothetical protein
MRLDKANWGNVYENGWPLEQVVVSDADKAILRDLAKRVAEHAAQQIQADRIALWTRHNDLQDPQPVLLVDAENGWNELIVFERDIECQGTMAQDWEMWLRKEIYWAEVVKDDRPIEATFYVPYLAENPDWGINESRIGLEDRSQAYTWKPKLEGATEEEMLALDVASVIPDLPVVVDYEASTRTLELAEEVFDGILQVRRRQSWSWSPLLVLAYAHYRGLETLMYDFYDYPDKVHEMNDRLTSTYIDKMQQIEREGLLTSNTGNSNTGSGGLGWTTQLAYQKPGEVRLMDMWGLTEAQEASGVSPKMYREFIFPYQLRSAELFGLNCFACCEAVDPRWEEAKKIPRLRRVSVSQWADADKAAQQLGSDYIYSYKASSSRVAQKHINEDHIREELAAAFQRAKVNENVLEVILKDLHTVGIPENVPRFVEIYREEYVRAY